MYGDLLAILTTMKGLPLSYNRDLQEDKVHLFDAIDTVRQTLPICAAMLDSVTVHGERTKSAIKDYVLATDIADYLVCKGMPFRSAHGVSARISADAAVQQRRLADFPVAELRKYSELFDDDVKNVTLESSLEARDVHGGTAPVRVAAALKAARRQLEGGS